jgi:type 1 glutamine amidotransferase
MLEVYYDARGPAKNVEVISYGQDPRFKDYWPLEWTVTYGQGRVYASSFGHVWSDEDEVKQPVDLLAADEQVLIMRAIQWLAKRPITVAVPADFPTDQKTSIRGNIPVFRWRSDFLCVLPRRQGWKRLAMSGERRNLL